MTTLPRRPVLLLCLALLPGAPAGCAPRKVVQVPTAEVAPLRLTLHARTTVYALDLGGQAPDEYRAALVAQVHDFGVHGPGFSPDGQAAKPTPQVDLELEIRNTSPRDVEFDVGGFGDLLTLQVFGPDLFRIERPGDAMLDPGREPARPKRVKLAPGESYFEPVTRLETSHPHRVCRWYWTQPGEYTVVATWQLPGPGRPDGPVYQSNPVTLTVREP
jgi:hypothetical protein